MIIYITDGTVNSFYTAVFDAYNCNDAFIRSDTNLQLGIDYKTIKVNTNEEKAKRVMKKLNALDKYAVEEINLVLRSSLESKQQTAFEYIKLIIKNERAVRNLLNNPTVLEMNDLRSKVLGETHRFKGFLRFMESQTGVLYAPFSPDNFIIDLLMPHFVARFKKERFVIHDVKRKIACLYDGKEWIMTKTDNAEVFLSAYEKIFDKLWKKYYRSINITERKNEKQMKGYMPVRYWPFLNEKN